jgi:hypothetical protein
MTGLTTPPETSPFKTLKEGSNHGKADHPRLAQTVRMVTGMNAYINVGIERVDIKGDANV